MKKLNTLIKTCTDFFERHAKLFKRIYIGLIVIFILYAFYSIRNQISWHDLMAAIHSLSISNMIILVLLGALAVTPMFIYDFIYAGKVNMNISKPELMSSSYIINTFTNIGGSGGAVGASLRVFLFGNLESNVETVKIVTQIALFTLSGLVTNDLLAIVLYFTNHLSFNWGLQLVLYCFPIYIVVPFFLKNKTMKKNDIIKVLIGSTLEWLACLVFFTSIGAFLGYHYNVFTIYVSVVAAGIVGAISLIPGGLGTFDAAMIATLKLEGLSLSQAAVWLVIYRLCYYIIPFLIGLILLMVKIIQRKIHANQANNNL